MIEQHVEHVHDASSMGARMVWVVKVPIFHCAEATSNHLLLEAKSFKETRALQMQRDSHKKKTQFEASHLMPLLTCPAASKLKIVNQSQPAADSVSSIKTHKQKLLQKLSPNTGGCFAAIMQVMTAFGLGGHRAMLSLTVKVENFKTNLRCGWWCVHLP